MQCASRRRMHQVPAVPLRDGADNGTPISSRTAASCFGILRQLRSVQTSLPRHAYWCVACHQLVLTKLDYCNSLLVAFLQISWTDSMQNADNITEIAGKMRWIDEFSGFNEMNAGLTQQWLLLKTVPRPGDSDEKSSVTLWWPSTPWYHERWRTRWSQTMYGLHSTDLLKLIGQVGWCQTMLTLERKDT